MKMPPRKRNNPYLKEIFIFNLESNLILAVHGAPELRKVLRQITKLYSRKKNSNLKSAANNWQQLLCGKFCNRKNYYLRSSTGFGGLHWVARPC